MSWENFLFMCVVGVVGVVGVMDLVGGLFSF